MYTLEEIKSLPTIHSGTHGNLKIEEENRRVWVSRMTVEDGAKHNNQVIVEYLVNNTWKVCQKYDPSRISRPNMFLNQ